MIKKAAKYFFSIFGLELTKTQSAAVEKSKQLYASVGANTDIKNVILDIRNPESDRKYFEVGDNSLITGTFVFEIGSGKIKIGSDTFIGGGTFICIDEIEIGNDVMFSWGCTVMDNNAHSLHWRHRKDDVKAWKKGVDENKIGKYKDWSNVSRKKITIKDKAWIGFDSIILKGVTIGEGAIVGAGSVVVKDVPDWTIVAGNPAQVIRTIPEDER